MSKLVFLLLVPLIDIYHDCIDLLWQFFFNDIGYTKSNPGFAFRVSYW